MKLKEWFEVKRQKRIARRQERLARKMAAESPEPVETKPLENEEPESPECIERKLVNGEPELQPLGADTEGIIQPESRFTEEYREFLKRQEEARGTDEIKREEF